MAVYFHIPIYWIPVHRSVKSPSKRKRVKKLRQLDVFGVVWNFASEYMLFIVCDTLSHQSQTSCPQSQNREQLVPLRCESRTSKLSRCCRLLPLSSCSAELSSYSHYRGSLGKLSHWSCCDCQASDWRIFLSWSPWAQVRNFCLPRVSFLIDNFF